VDKTRNVYNMFVEKPCAKWAFGRQKEMG